MGRSRGLWAWLVTGAVALAAAGVLAVHPPRTDLASPGALRVGFDSQADLALFPGGSLKGVSLPSGRLAPEVRGRDLPSGEDAAWVDPDAVYDVVKLDRPIRTVEGGIAEAPQERARLVVEHGGGAWTVPVEEGAAVDLGDETCRVVEVAPWAGLLRQPDGRPMAHLAVTGGTPEERDVFLADGEWVTVGADASLLFTWLDAPDEWDEVVDRLGDPLFGARWGVVEGRRIQWFRSFRPGTGLDLEGGGAIVLQGVDAGSRPPRIAASILPADGGPATRLDVAANAPGVPSRVRFEAPAARERVYVLGGEAGGAGRFLRARDGEGAIQRLAPGDVVRLGPTLDGVYHGAMASAVAVTRDESLWTGATLACGEARLRLREGIAERLGGARVRLEVERTPPRVWVRLAPRDEGSGPVLRGNRSILHEGWRVGVAPGDPRAPEQAVLAVTPTRPLYGPAAGLAAGGVLAMGAGVLLWRRRQAGRPAS